MKAKWIITYWDNNKDCACKVGVHSHEDAMTLSERLKRKGHNNVQIHLKSC